MSAKNLLSRCPQPAYAGRLPRRLRVDPRRGYYYVSVIDGGRLGLLLGPFRRHRQALRFVARARREAQRVDQWSCFYAFGTVRLADGVLPGVLNGALGFVAKCR